MKDRVEMRFGVVAPPAGIQGCCKRCGKIFQRGAAMIEVEIVGDSKAYTLASKDKITCCGEEKKVNELFASAEEAESMIQILERGLEESGTIQIPLNQLAQMQPDGSEKPFERPRD